MRPSTLPSTLFLALLPPALISTIYLYFYPVFHRCDFPSPKPGESGCFIGNCTPPFRLLALGDPQLEGDTSLPDPNAPLCPSWILVEESARSRSWLGFKDAVEELVKNDVVKLLQGYRKRLDLWGNDLYLAHIYRTISWWTQPTHTVVLGDLLGSQWIGDGEFGRRTERFWNRVFPGAEKVPGSITNVEGATEVIGKDESWKNRIIAVVGNHDIGYAGDINEHRVERFEEAYGPVNWDIRFRLENANTGNTTDSKTSAPELHLIILNSMNLDDPAYNSNLQSDSRNFIDQHLHNPERSTASTTATLLLTHIPFHKQPDICVDAPFFSYFPDDQGGGIREQNHLSKHVSGHILNGLLREGSGQAIVLNGHDHEGCDTFHYREREDGNGDEGAKRSWDAKGQSTAASERTNASLTGLREITVRSMMGSFGGNAGLLSAWFDHDTQEWKFEYDVCALGVQHIWWAIHILDLVVVWLGIAWILAGLVEVAWMKSRLSAAAAGGGKVKKA